MSTSLSSVIQHQNCTILLIKKQTNKQKNLHKENRQWGQICAKEKLILQVVLYMAVVQVTPCVGNSKVYAHLLFVQKAENLGNVPNLSLHAECILQEKNITVEVQLSRRELVPMLVELNRRKYSPLQ